MKVEDKVLHPLLFQFEESLFYFLSGRGGKTVELDVSRMFICHISGIETVYWNLATDNAEIEQLRLIATFYFDIHFGALRPS